jgi:hypothetical protein
MCEHSQLPTSSNSTRRRHRQHPPPNTDDYGFAEVVASTNLNAVAYPWWSVINIFEIPDLSVQANYPDNRDFFGLGDSFAAGIGAHCGDILEDDPSGGDCKKCKGAYPYQ